MSRRYTSPRLRYLKARLSVLARPSFLIAAVFLAVVGFAVKEYWTNPDFLKFAQTQKTLPTSPNQSSLSEEDRAIAADIDNLSILDYDQQIAGIPITTDLKESNKSKKQNEAQLTKILDFAKKSEAANKDKLNIKSPPNQALSASQQNPFVSQAESLLKFNFGNQEQTASANNPSNANNLSPFASEQTPQGLSNLGINNNSNSESALKTAINQPNSQSQSNSTAVTSNSKNTFGQFPQTNNAAPTPTSSANQDLRQNSPNPLVDTTIFNQPLNNQGQNASNNFYNQLPTTNYNQTDLNNQIQNPYNNFYNQPNNNQLPVTNYNQQNFSNQIQNPNNNFYNQLPATNYNQQNFNNQSQNPYNNLNNNQITGTRYSPEVQTRVNNIYNRLINRDSPNIITPNIYTAPNNGVNQNFQQPVQQFTPNAPQNPVQYPNNGYGY